MSVDLEFTQPTQKIFQIGACIGDTVTGKILGSISLYINPYEPLTDYIKNLCHVSQSQVDSGMTTAEAYDCLKRFYQSHDTFRNLLTWGCGDVEALRKAIPDWELGRSYINAKAVMQSLSIANNQRPYGGLAKSLTKLNLKFQGTQHNAEDDSINTFLIYFALLQKLKSAI